MPRRTLWASHPPTAPESIKLTSSAFGKNDTIPKEFTCDGADAPPPLQWSNVPKESKELALFVEDPDAPGGNFVHWTVYGIDPAAHEVTGNVLEGENSAGKKGYTGPCPPEGDDPHRYVFALYALDEAIGLAAGASPDAVRTRARPFGNRPRPVDRQVWALTGPEAHGCSPALWFRRPKVSVSDHQTVGRGGIFPGRI